MRISFRNEFLSEMNFVLSMFSFEIVFLIIDVSYFKKYLTSINFFIFVTSLSHIIFSIFNSPGTRGIERFRWKPSGRNQGSKLSHYFFYSFIVNKIFNIFLFRKKIKAFKFDLFLILFIQNKLEEISLDQQTNNNNNGRTNEELMNKLIEIYINQRQ